jgi:hypothetical protein
MSANSADAQVHLLRSIDCEIEILGQSILALKHRRNTIVPISHLPPESLAFIFSFLSPSECDEEVYYRTLIRATHVCRSWRETALDYPTLWSHIDFIKLRPAGIAGILARAKMVPLHLEVSGPHLSKAQFKIFKRQLGVHITHTREISLSGRYRALFERFVSSAPILESLLVSDSLRPSGFIIPNTLFNGAAPKLTNLTLIHDSIRWNSPLLKGLRVLVIVKPPKRARPTLRAWLDALNQMFQLEVLTLHDATPINSVGGLHVFEPRRTVTLPSLTQFDICASAEDCALALAHLVLPVLTSLKVAAEPHSRGGNDIGLLIPHVARNAHGPQDTGPLQTMVLTGMNDTGKIIAWNELDINIKGHDLTTKSLSARVVFTFTSTTKGILLDALLTHLPTNAISTLAMHEFAIFSKEFWHRHASRLSMLKLIQLDSFAVGAFRDMLAGDPPENSSRFPKLTGLILVDVKLTALRTYRLRDMLMKRVVQGVPLQALHLCRCSAATRAIQLLAEAVGDVYGPAKTLETGDPPYFNWKGGAEFFDEEEKLAEDDEYGILYVDFTDSGEDGNHEEEDDDDDDDEDDDDDDEEEFEDQ